MNKKIELIKSILLFPFMMLIVVPFTIVRFEGFSLLSRTNPLLWVCVLLLFFGFGLMLRSVRLLCVAGDGTPAPWAPPTKLVTVGAYAHVRNPMMLGILLVLFSKSIILQSFGLCVWFWVLVVLNVMYFKLVEEKELEARFGDEYITYKKSVPMWAPRLKAYNPGN